MTSIDFHKIIQQLVYDPQSPLIFSSGLFLFLFLAFLAVYRFGCRDNRSRILWTTLFSVYFYYKSSGIYFLLLVLSVVVDYNLARWIQQATSPTRRYLLIVCSVVANLGLLAYFKYTNYLFELWANISGGHFEPLDIFLPVGISFFTFQSLSYTIDVYRGELKALDNILDYAFFVTFFPQMVAGPIVRAADFLPQINREPFVSAAQFNRGVFLFCTGLFKKAVISDYISQNFVDRIFEAPEKFTGLENLFGLYGYALQIYNDFSGYSDMAIGIGLLLGYQFPLNFNSPYQSLSITEFWRRWHISLSTWLRDYLYIPLGGNRKGRGRTYVNLFLTMLLGGLWHGAATRFLVWGGLHGLGLVMERFWKEMTGRSPGTFQKILGWVWTFHFVCFCWLFFRAQDMNQVGIILERIAFNFNGQLIFEFIQGYFWVVACMILSYFLHFMPSKSEQFMENAIGALPLLAKAALVSLFILLVMQVKSSDVQPFIYFQF